MTHTPLFDAKKLHTPTPREVLDAKGFIDPAAIAAVIAQRDELAAALRALLARRHECFIPEDAPDMYEWTERARAALAKVQG
jgi:hypothetical protein